MMWGEGAGVGHKAWEIAGLSLDTWKVGCTHLIVGGSLIRTAVGLMIFSMVKGPTKRGDNFLVPPLMGMSLVESHTRCPTRYVGAGTSCQQVASSGPMLWPGWRVRLSRSSCISWWMPMLKEPRPPPPDWGTVVAGTLDNTHTRWQFGGCRCIAVDGVFRPG